MLRKILILLLLIPVVGFSESSEKPITIGLIHFSAPLSNDMDFSPSLEHLQKVFAPRKVIAKVYSSPIWRMRKEGKSIFLRKFRIFLSNAEVWCRDLRRWSQTRSRSPTSGQQAHSSREGTEPILRLWKICATKPSRPIMNRPFTGIGLAWRSW